MRTTLLAVMLAMCAGTAAAQKTTEIGPNGLAQFTARVQRQLAAEGFRPDGTGAFYKIVEPATTFTPAKVKLFAPGGG